MDSGQIDAAKALVESYRAEFDAAAKETRDKMRAIREEAQESRDFSAMEQMGPVMEKFSKKSAEMEKAVLGDIKTLLNDNQAAKWPLVERTRRRERTIDRGNLAGESVDLVRVVDGLDLKPDAKLALADALEQYQSDLDRALIERNKVLDEDSAQQQPFNGRLVLDLEDMQKRTKKVRDAGELVRGVNQKYAKVFEPLVGDDAKAQFQTEVKRQSFPQVYRPSRTSKAMDAR
jgi:gas vesicle protein